MAKRLPVVLLGDELASIFDAEVACQRIVMMPANQLRANDFRDVG